MLLWPLYNCLCFTYCQRQHQVCPLELATIFLGLTYKSSLPHDCTVVMRVICAAQDSPRGADRARGRRLLETDMEREGRQFSHQERRMLKEKFVKEQSNFGRVNYGMRVAWVDRLALVNGQIYPK